jgi:lipoate-protein ligase A
LGIELVEGVLTPEEEVLKTRLLSDKYMTDRWNMEGKGTNYGY